MESNSGCGCGAALIGLGLFVLGGFLLMTGSDSIPMNGGLIQWGVSAGVIGLFILVVGMCWVSTESIGPSSSGPGSSDYYLSPEKRNDDLARRRALDGK